MGRTLSQQTVSQIQILGQTMTNKQISQLLGVNLQTVQKYVIPWSGGVCSFSGCNKILRRRNNSGLCAKHFNIMYKRNNYDYSCEYLGVITCKCGRKGRAYKKTFTSKKTGWSETFYSVLHSTWSPTVYKSLRTTMSSYDAKKKSMIPSYCYFKNLEDL